ncbi:MAG: glycoside hydrolase family 5 protein [Bacteroides sp.]|nr:glycoside hydrolase family 5 protein [Bacteroides sp.]
MKNTFLSGLIGLLCICCGVCCTTNQAKNRSNAEHAVSAVKTPVELHGKLSVRGTQLVGGQGETVVLKGVSYGWHNLWPRFYNAASARYLVEEWDATVLRAAMGVMLKNSYLENPELALSCVTQVVDAAIDNGVYVIIDWHSHNIHTEEAKVFFAEMARKYKGVPNVIYEIFNEPVEDSWQQVKAYSEEVIAVIREIEPDAVILVGSPHWDQDVHIAADDPITGYDNLMYTLHFYAATHGQELRDRGNYALAKGLPLFVSECAGMEATGDGPIDHAEWQRWLDWMHSNGLSWAAWSVSDKEETCSMILKQGTSEGGWTDSDLREWGRMVRDELRSPKD